MSTHALTSYFSRELDGENLEEVGHFWRKFDGHPTGHGYDLKRVLQARQFETLWELVGAVTNGLRKNIRGKNYNWMFVPVDPHTTPHLSAEFSYELSLVDQDGGMPRGGAWGLPYDVRVVVKQKGQTLYDGLLNDYIPEDPSE